MAPPPSWPVRPPSHRPSVEPLAPARYRVQFTASTELREKLVRLQNLMRSQVPDGDLETIIDDAVTEKLKRLEEKVDFVLCEGTDFSGVSSAFEFDWNAELASQIGAPILLVAGARGKEPDEAVDFLARGQGYQVFLSEGDAVLDHLAPVGIGARDCPQRLAIKRCSFLHTSPLSPTPRRGRSRPGR